jgi:hypothetical protein
VGGWIGVDLDGTLAHYDEWPEDGSVGAPIAPMVERVKDWIGQGIEVRILTARVHPHFGAENAKQQYDKIRAWTKEHVGTELHATCSKDFGMVELWDDRAVRVKHNEGVPCCG